MFADSYQAQRRGSKRLAARNAMIFLVVLILVGVPLAALLLRRIEQSIVFHPERAALNGTWNLPARGEDVWFKTSDGVRLHGWFVRASEQPPVATVLYAHGNGGNISYIGWVAEDFSERGFDVLLFDYRGYGRSEGEVSDERGIYSDTDAAYDYLVRERGAVAERLVLYGQSLGTTAVVDVASRKPCAALVLESGLSSAGDMAALVLPWLPRALHRFGRNRFDSARKLSNINCPVLVAHGARDEVIPVEQGRALFAAAREPKELIIVSEAGHNDLVAVGGEEYLGKVGAFIRRAVGSRHVEASESLPEAERGTRASRNVAAFVEVKKNKFDGGERRID
jgi:fermentation-respiration switch protein FrsA (DUF1100 family)